MRANVLNCAQPMQIHQPQLLMGQDGPWELVSNLF